MLSNLFFCGTVWATLTTVVPSPWNSVRHDLSRLSPRANSTTTNSASVCSGNSANDRSVWCELTISTDYYDEASDTGVLVEYWLELTNLTAYAPDGVARDVLAVNGSVPGSTIIASWGDTVRMHVTNSLANNGMSIYFHGIRQNWTNLADGVASVTHCPTTPGNIVTYEWQATQYGCSWYHSHYALQAWEGVFGGIVIHGPATANYDEDLGSLFLNDWDHATMDSLYSFTQTRGPPTLDTGLINGMNTWDNGTADQGWTTDFTSGKSYLLRLVNAAIDTHFDFMIDNHTLQVIAVDFVPIEPYYTEVLSIGIGQRRYERGRERILAESNPRYVLQQYDNGADIRGIIHYDGSTATPATSAYAYNARSCGGEPYASLVPYFAIDASPSATLSDDLPVTVGQNAEKLFKWFIGGTSLLIQWKTPTALQVLNNDTDYGSSSGVIELPTAGEWAYIVIETTLNIPHPIHLQGHDFFVLAQGTRAYAAATPTLQTSNPPRQDVMMFSASGYLVLAFQAKNPSVWLAHCHIGWHTQEGFILQFIKRASEIPPLYNRIEMVETCDAWTAWQTDVGLLQEVSGV